ncbi:hypothetical protein KC363_g65 [Hortaea werneckii]|nr:hypothetical protein KC363_g65 [Hortaea werneckii]
MLPPTLPLLSCRTSLASGGGLLILNLDVLPDFLGRESLRLLLSPVRLATFWILALRHRGSIDVLVLLRFSLDDRSLLALGIRSLGLPTLLSSLRRRNLLLAIPLTILFVNFMNLALLRPLLRLLIRRATRRSD